MAARERAHAAGTWEGPQVHRASYTLDDMEAHERVCLRQRHDVHHIVSG
jgi:hypothetical protein